MWLLLVVLCFALSVGLHALASRVRRAANRVVSYAIVASSAGVVLTVGVFARYGPDVQAWAALFLYALAAELYVFAFTMIGSSITARLLITLRTRDMTPSEIDAVFPTSRMVEDRMRNLLRNGFIRADGGSTYALTPWGRLMVLGFRPLRSFFRHKHPA